IEKMKSSFRKEGYLIYTSIYFLMFFLMIFLGQTLLFKWQILAYSREVNYYRARVMYEVVKRKNCDSENFNYGKVMWDKERRKYIIILKNGREYQFK
ncbi:hypothetical protein, partial [Ligilactobacillus salivarius]